MFLPGGFVFFLGRKIKLGYLVFLFSQLFYDGYSQIAMTLTTEVQADPPCPPSERLLHVVNEGLQHERDRNKNRDPTPGLNAIQEILIGPGLGL